MTPGPKPKPTEVAELQGNPGHRPLVKSPDALPGIDGSAPERLDAIARDIWLSLMPRLKSLGYVRATDAFTLERYCGYASMWLGLKIKVTEIGVSYETESKHGKMQRINPDFAALLRVEDKMQALEDRFGLTPAARQQILARVTDPGDLQLSLPGSAAHQDSTSSPIGLFAPRPRASGEVLN